ncbi:MAG: VapB-type antitoxin [Thermoprotei archaeon]|nr:MAG: VapB-type antitoxin [Thermoprotei archaeon]
MQSTTIRISKNTLELLEAYKRKVGARSFDEAIRRLLLEYRRSLVNKYFGIDKGKISKFTEEDRLEDRSIH